MARRLLLVIPALSQGGAERQLLELARRMARLFDVTLCTLFEDNHYAAPADVGLRHIDLGLRTQGTTRAFKRLIALIRNEKFDLIQSFMDQANFWVRAAALFAGPPQPAIVTSVRGPWMQINYLLVEKLLTSAVDGQVIVNSRSTAEEMRSWARLPANRVHIVHNFVDFDVFRPAPSAARAVARRRFGVADDDVTLLLSGRLSLQKHHLGLAVALRRLSKRNALPPQVKFLFAGRPRDRWYARLVGPALRWAGVEDRVRWLGTVSPQEVPTLYAATDVLLLPSLWEGLPNVALEAQASGIPVIASDKANMDDIVADGETGFVAPLEFSMRKYAEAIDQALQLSPEERQAMGLRGRSRVLNLFDPKRVLEDFLTIYRTVLGEKPTETTLPTSSKMEIGAKPSVMRLQ